MPTITCSPATVRTGDTVVVTGSGFQRYAKLRLVWKYGAPVKEVACNRSGAFSTTLTATATVTGPRELFAVATSAIITVEALPPPPPPPPAGTLWHVAPAALGSADGTSPDNAMTLVGLNALQQNGRLQPGHTVMLKGGIYRDTLNVYASGSLTAPITITTYDQDSNVVLFGGRETALPYAWQPSGEYLYTRAPRDHCINIAANVHDVRIRGKRWFNITCRAAGHAGIHIDSTAKAIGFDGLRIEDNGWAFLRNDRWAVDGFGVYGGGNGIIFEHTLIQDNGQDGVQLPSVPWGNWSFYRSVLRNTRTRPDGSTFNQDDARNGTHADGFQMWHGVHRGLTFRSCIIGPRLTQGILCGDNQAIVHGVIVDSCLLYGSVILLTRGGPTSLTPEDWSVYRSTLDCQAGGPSWGGELIEGSPDVSIQQCILTSGTPGAVLPHVGEGVNCRDNYYFNTAPVPGGTQLQRAPYLNLATLGSISPAADYTVDPTSAAFGALQIGSPITSANQMFAEW